MCEVEHQKERSGKNALMSGICKASCQGFCISSSKPDHGTAAEHQPVVNNAHDAVNETYLVQRCWHHLMTGNLLVPAPVPWLDCGRLRHEMVFKPLEIRHFLGDLSCMFTRTSSGNQ